MDKVYCRKTLAIQPILSIQMLSRTGSQVSRYLREAALQPHKSRYWLNTTEKDPV